MQGSAILPKRRAESIGAATPLSTRKAAAWSQYSRLGRQPIARRRAGLCEAEGMGREECEGDRVRLQAVWGEDHLLVGGGDRHPPGLPGFRDADQREAARPSGAATTPQGSGQIRDVPTRASVRPSIRARVPARWAPARMVNACGARAGEGRNGAGSRTAGTECYRGRAKDMRETHPLPAWRPGDIAPTVLQGPVPVNNAGRPSSKEERPGLSARAPSEASLHPSGSSERERPQHPRSSHSCWCCQC